MRLDRFDLNLLVVLDALLEERNVTRTGERLCIGQSAASAALKRLRDYFEDELLVPAGRRLEPTPLAQSLVGPVRDALLRARAAISLRPSFDPAVADNSFVICASDYIIGVTLARAVALLTARAPALRFDLRRPPRDIAETFERGDIDLIVLPEQYTRSLGHPSRELMRDSHVCMVSADHPLGAADLTMEAYFDLGHVAARLGDEASLSFEEWFLPRYGRQRRVECTVDYFSALPLLVQGTTRIATLHERLANDMAKRFPVKLLPAPFQMEPLVEMMVWPRHKDQDPAHRWMREQIFESSARRREA
jgi:DNA-binding transcriptional LysR family regulator